MANNQFQDSLQRLGSLFNSNRIPEARALALRLKRSMPGNLKLLSMLGMIHGRLGEFTQAESCYKMLTMREPNVFHHHYYLGLALVMQNRLREAVQPLQETLWLRPEFAEAHMQMGCLLRDLGQHDVAIRHLEHALGLSPALLDAAVFLGNLHVFRGQLKEARACFERALSVNPAHPEALAGKALVLERQGERDMAWGCLQPAVKAGQLTPNVAIMYALLSPHFGPVDHARQVLGELLANKAITPTQKQEMHFALAKLNDKIGDYGAAFANYQAANQLNQLPFDAEVARQAAQIGMARFSALAMPKRAVQPASPTPIFIVGMPRSGTTLAEQILACHPAIAAAGELETLPEIEREVVDILGKVGQAECLDEESARGLEALAEKYLQTIRAVSAGAQYVTDKLPGNYTRLGLIEKLFPNAVIIHMRRDPRDTCLSCYCQNFGNTHAYAADLRALGEVYRIYEHYMAHWKDTLSIKVLDVDYEALVNNTEEEVRAMLAFCGLPWEPRCLEFHASRRYVNTASYDQVRQPVYDSSVGRWKHYEPYLGELIDSLNRESGEPD